MCRVSGLTTISVFVQTGRHSGRRSGRHNGRHAGRGAQQETHRETHTGRHAGRHTLGDALGDALGDRLGISGARALEINRPIRVFGRIAAAELTLFDFPWKISLASPGLERLGGATLVVSITVYSDNIVQYRDGRRHRVAKVFFFLPPPFNNFVVESLDAVVQQPNPSL
jgi:hypothetical protein